MRFGFLVAPPNIEGLFETYEQALEVLDSIEANKEIVEEQGIRDYVEEAVETARAFEVGW